MIDINVNIFRNEECTEKDFMLAIDKIKYASEKGVKKMVIAFERKNTEEISMDEISSRVSILRKKLDEKKINVNIYVAQKIKLSEYNLIECLNGEFLNINKSKYMLVDLDGTMTNRQIDMVYELTLKNIVPIIVHPERYSEVINKVSRIEKLKELGCLFQLDINSLTGLYGAKTKRIAKYLLNHNIYNFVASESSSKVDRYSYSVLSKSKQDVFRKNGLKVLRNENVKNHIGTEKIKRKLLWI